MPRYFFDVIESGPADAMAHGPDETGTVFAEMQAVREAALRFLPEILRDDPRTELRRREFGVHVRDEGGRTVYRASLVLRGDDGET